MGLTQAVHEIADVPIDYIFLVMREMPGFNFVDAGQHVPDYVPGPDGHILPATNSFESARRQSRRQRHSEKQRQREKDMPFIQCDIEVGLSDEKKRLLVERMTEVTHKAIRFGLRPYQRRLAGAPFL